LLLQDPTSGSLWEPSGSLLGASGSLLGAVRELLGAFWESFESFWELLGAFWEPLGAFWEPFGSLLGAFWEPSGNLLGTFREPSGSLLNLPRGNPPMRGPVRVLGRGLRVIYGAHLVRALPALGIADSKRRRARGFHLPSEPSITLGRAPEVGTTVKELPLILDPRLGRFPTGGSQRLPEGSQKAPRSSQQALRRLPDGSQKLPEAP